MKSIKTGIVYPKIYVVTAPKTQRKPGTEFLDGEIVDLYEVVPGEVEEYFSFGKDYYGESTDCELLAILGAVEPSYREIRSLDANLDGWISVIRVGSRAEYDGYCRARSIAPVSFDFIPVYDTCLIETDSGLFACTWHQPYETPEYNGIIIYKSTYRVRSDGKYTNHGYLDEDEVLVIDRDGSMRDINFLARLAQEKCVKMDQKKLH